MRLHLIIELGKTLGVFSITGKWIVRLIFARI